MRHGSHIDPPNRYERVHREADLEHFEWDPEYRESRTNRPIEYIDDASRSIISENDSPDIPFRYSLNPYRGCIHGCSYCYARPGHEYLGMNAGLDFETRIVVKRQAPRLFRDFLCRTAWKPEPIAFSGVTDCYQPAEREFRLTRQCLEVAAEARQPISIITKNALIVRDLDLLQPLAEQKLVRVYLSITTLQTELAAAMEPRTSIPEARLRAVRELTAAGIPAGVMLAPVIPGLNEPEIPAILEAAADAGAQAAGYILLRLPEGVEEVFLEWLERTQPGHAAKVMGRIRQCRDGQVNSPEWGKRMTGTGPVAEQIRHLFLLFQKKYGLQRNLPAHDCSLFRPPASGSGQQYLF